jgi:membrane fusion protein (multidrug efflux system)
VLLLALLAGALPGCGSKEKAVEAGSPVYAVPVEAVAAESRQLSITKTFSGPIEGENQAQIIARLAERVTGVKVRIGEAVRAGQIIVTLDRSGPASQYLQAEANYKNTEKTLERMKSLFGEGAVSQQTVDGAQTAYDVAKANFDAARSNVELTTPIAGLVTALNVSDGDLAAAGSAVATVASIGKMKVIFNINETDVTNLSVDQPVSVYSEANPARMGGRIILMSRSADPRSRLFEVKALFPNAPGLWFRPGMFCKVDVTLSPRERTVVIPSAAILSDGTTDRAFVIRQGRAFMRTVLIGLSDGQQTAVLRGLTAGDSVATAGVTDLKDSCAVTVVSK